MTGCPISPPSLCGSRAPNDIEGAFAPMTRSRAGAWLILGGGLTYESRQQIADGDRRTLAARVSG
jgi:hypothetical protein